MTLFLNKAVTWVTLRGFVAESIQRELAFQTKIECAMVQAFSNAKFLSSPEESHVR